MKQIIFLTDLRVCFLEPCVFVLCRSQALAFSSSAFLIVTNIKFIAAGVTPSIFEADPIVSGCALNSFSTTSFERPVIFL